MKTVKPMLAASVDSFGLNAIWFPKYGSIKLDGIRCVMKGRQATSRSGKPIRNLHIQKCLEPLAGRGFDGELMVYDENGAVLPFKDISSAVMSVDGEPNFTYNVFDLWDNGRSYGNRYQDLWYHVQYCQSSCPQLVMHSHIMLRSLDELLEFERTVLKAGHEGVILREPVSWYKHGRSTLIEQGMLKLKRHLDYETGVVCDYMEIEATVTGFDEYMITEESGKYSDELGFSKSSSSQEFKVPGNMLGKLWVQDSDGVEFALGTGLTHELRKELWGERDTLKGRVVKLKYMHYGTADKPRHPVFLGFRDRDDLDPDPFGLALV